MTEQDFTGQNIRAQEAGWTFGGETPISFSEHVRKSVPFYDAGHDLVAS